VLIDPFEVPAGEDDAFLAGWDDARARLAERQGYLGARLHRADRPRGVPLRRASRAGRAR
jgi:hypothetical protein